MSHPLPSITLSQSARHDLEQRRVTLRAVQRVLPATEWEQLHQALLDDQLAEQRRRHPEAARQDALWHPAVVIRGGGA